MGRWLKKLEDMRKPERAILSSKTSVGFVSSLLREPERLEKGDDIDSRRYCSQCANLTNQGLCLAAKRGKLANTSRKYHPITSILKNCSGYAPRTASQGVWEELRPEPDPFEHFLTEAHNAGLALLSDDIAWLRSIGYNRVGKQLLEQYIHCWLEAMNDEKIEFKNQNNGRVVANTFIRNTIDGVLTKPTKEIVSPL